MKSKIIIQVVGFILLCLSPAVCECVEPLAQLLAQPLEVVMTQGGDDRIIIPAGAAVNKYFTGPLCDPRTIARSSSTSSSVSLSGFDAARKLFDRLRSAQAAGSAEQLFDLSMHAVREEIKHFWGSRALKPCSVITTPSGSDGEMLPAFAALARHSLWGIKTDSEANHLVTNIVIASGEVGSGTALAAGLKHFSSLVPSGNLVVNGTSITGVTGNEVAVVELKIRDEQGVVIPADELENSIAIILQKAIEQEGQIGVLHMVHACKTGIGAPRENFVQAMKSLYKDKLVVVIDAAQLRMDEPVVSSWLDKGFWVVITGSKFLGGPSFSGAVLIPKDEAASFGQISAEKIPAGLGDYFTQADCDEYFDNFKQALPGWYNVGLVLRWQAALAEASRFYTTNSLRRDRGLALWARDVRAFIDRSPILTLLENITKSEPSGVFAENIGTCNTVISFGVRAQTAAGENNYLNMAQLRKVHQLMTLDLRPLLPGLSVQASDIAKTLCLIGQPVQIGTAGPCQAVLRMAIGAPELFKVTQFKKFDPAILINDVLIDDRVVIQKIELIANNWAVFNRVK